jgi:hypothetical protein
MSMMQLDTARDIIRRHNAGQKVDYADFAAAGAVVYANHMRGRNRRLPLTYDSAPTFAQRMEQQRRARDQISAIPRSLVGNVTEGGAAPEGGIGPVRVMQLNGPASAYQIMTDAEGVVWLVKSYDIDGTLDPGTTLTGDRLKQILTNDAKQNNTRLKAINAANKAFWGTGHGA